MVSEAGATIRGHDRFSSFHSVWTFFWFDPAPLTQSRYPGGAPSSSGSLWGFGVKKWYFLSWSGVRTTNLEHQKRTLYPLHHAPPGYGIDKPIPFLILMSGAARCCVDALFTVKCSRDFPTLTHTAHDSLNYLYKSGKKHFSSTKHWTRLSYSDFESNHWFEELTQVCA